MSDISHSISPTYEPGVGLGALASHAELSPSVRSSPAEFANALVASIKKGTEAIIQAGEIASQALREFPAASPQRKQFFGELVDLGFLSEKEARAEGQSPKISKLCAIGDEAAFLRGSQILPRLSAGYSNLYEAVQLVREVRKHSAEAEEKMAALLEGANGDVNREFLVNTRKALKRREALEEQDTEHSDSEVQPTIADASAPAELLLLTPGKNDLRHFSGDYSNPDALAALKLNQMVAKNAVALCIIETRDYPIVADRVLPLAGFKYIKKVHLLSKPASSEITDAKIAVVAARTNNTLPEVMEPWVAGAIDDRALAIQIAPNAISKLHAFASDSAIGWTCLPGGDVWTEMPSLKGAV